MLRFVLVQKCKRLIVSLTDYGYGEFRKSAKIFHGRVR